ncbi:hypothetical protein ALC53_03803 [Atta colombica]|uniref:Uncharacterized protein n=1 Tax=Atta colombica TaxID=520822 RepID=A0A195BNQ6_9HYME|nr:hypothetical protein ALC53_03803 [Atta colombica]
MNENRWPPSAMFRVSRGRREGEREATNCHGCVDENRFENEHFLRYGIQHTDLFCLRDTLGYTFCLLACLPIPPLFVLLVDLHAYEKTTIVNNSACVTLSDERVTSSCRRRCRRGTPLLFVEPRADKFVMSCVECPSDRYVEYERPAGRDRNDRARITCHRSIANTARIIILYFYTRDLMDRKSATMIHRDLFPYQRECRLRVRECGRYVVHISNSRMYIERQKWQLS